MISSSDTTWGESITWSSWPKDLALSNESGSMSAVFELGYMNLVGVTLLLSHKLINSLAHISEIENIFKRHVLHSASLHTLGICLCICHGWLWGGVRYVVSLLARSTLQKSRFVGRARMWAQFWVRTTLQTPMWMNWGPSRDASSEVVSEMRRNREEMKRIAQDPGADHGYGDVEKRNSWDAYYSYWLVLSIIRGLLLLTKYTPVILFYIIISLFSVNTVLYLIIKWQCWSGLDDCDVHSAMLLRAGPDVC